MIYLFMNHGGMGNQMYQYATARKLQCKYGGKMVCDLSKYAYSGTETTQRGYVLDQFCLTKDMKYGRRKLAKVVFAIKRRVLMSRFRALPSGQRLKELMKRGIYTPEGYFDWFPDPEMKTKMCCVNGLFQAHGYFDEIRPILQEEFTLKQPVNGEIADLMQRMSGENAVCVHWRRGDYLAPQYAQSLLVCTDEYYDRAMESIAGQTENPIFYIFTNSAEDAQYIRDHHEFKYPVRYVNLMLKENHRDIEDFALMCACRHYVISNSTFSWWAQYLNDHDDKIVCAPSIWNRNENAQTLYQEHWVLIPVE